MAIFKKTLTYNLSPSANPADVVNNTSTQIGSASVFVPENSSTTPVRFTSVMLFVANQDVSTVTGATISNFQIFKKVRIKKPYRNRHTRDCKFYPKQTTIRPI